MEQVLYATILIFIAIGIAWWNRVGTEKDLIVGGIRAMIQLIAVGYVLHIVFALNTLWSQLLLLLLMTVIAAWTARGRAKEVAGVFGLSFVGIVAGTVVSIGVLVATGVIQPVPRYLIPLGGMVIGNTMTATALVLDRFYHEIDGNRRKVEFALSLGFSVAEASRDYLKRSVRASMTPIINTLKIVGIIQLPGAMTGMLMAGATPIEAARYQLIIMYMIASAISVAAVTTIVLARKRFFNGDAGLAV
ncbi:MAG: iron export ABC transporter permease subunit FetB [Acidobacteria bacterium]|nr:iron export ABC transporter permease subunit FetB [Acidobacteriota bacterium]